MNDSDAKALLDEIKAMMLLILQLLGMGMKQKQIALMLGISEATMSRMVPKGLSIGSAT
jgi:DNA-binding NarL/FixJ family response regulator